MLFKAQPTEKEAHTPTFEESLKNPRMSIFVLTRNPQNAKYVIEETKKSGRSLIIFEPSAENCPYYNPLFGSECDVIDSVVAAFRKWNPDLPPYFLDLAETLIGNAIKVLKRLDKDQNTGELYSNLTRLNDLLQNDCGRGRALVQQFSMLSSKTMEEAKENADIVMWFMNEYFAEDSKIYRDTSGVRSQFSKLETHELLYDTLIPYDEVSTKRIDFDALMAEHSVVCFNLAGLRDLGTMLGHLLWERYCIASAQALSSLEGNGAHHMYLDDDLQFLLIAHAPFSAL